MHNVAEANSPTAAQTDEVRKTLQRVDNRTEIMRRFLLHCQSEQSIESAEAFLAEQPEYLYGVMILAPCSLIDLLAKCKGISLYGLTPEGEKIHGESIGQLMGQADDSTVLYLKTTPAGILAANGLSPMKRLQLLMSKHPERASGYLAVLKACCKPKSLSELNDLPFSKQTDASSHLAGEPTLDAGFYVEQLERCGGLIWKGAWCTTKEGKEFERRGQALQPTCSGKEAQEVKPIEKR